MAVAMRKKRAWSARADDAESQETAAFEATVAAAKDTAAKSGAFLSTAKSDLTDHQRWLQAQSVAVERDRQRHERWLQRQRNYRLAAARKDRRRRRRRVMRQRAFQAMRHAIWAGALFVRSWFLFAIAKIWAGIVDAGRLIARATTYLAHQIVEGARYVAVLIARGAVALASRIRPGIAWMSVKSGHLMRQSREGISAATSWARSKVLASARASGLALASGSSSAGSKVGALSRSAGRSLRSGWTVAAAKSSTLQRVAKRNLASGLQWTKARTEAVSPTLYVGMAKLGRQAKRYARAGAAHAEGIMARASAKAAKPATGVTAGPQAEAGVAAAAGERHAAEIYGPFYEGFWVDGVSPNEPRVLEAAPDASRGSEENALSSLSSWAHGARKRAAAAAARTRVLIAPWVAQAKLWADHVQERARTRDVGLSRMMIIAGTVLLVCGGLLLGGGLFLRAGTGTTATTAAEEDGAFIAWTFMETDKPLSERAVFTLSGTPASFRINGMSVGGVNLSNQRLTGVEGVLKPDAKRPDLKLTLEVASQTEPAGEGDANVRAVVPAGTVPAGAAFRLVFPFPPEAMGEEGGITVEEYFESYGGLLLKLHYEVEGTQRSLIRYLPPDALKAQLDEVSAAADG
jgi:hypothetical protein